MSTVNPTATQQTQNQQTGVASEPTSEPKMGEEFNSFIKLLTAQVRNQDPLSPMDSTQFVEQLATFSNLEQQVRGNESLESIATMIGDLHGMLASEWLGESVSVESSWVPYSGKPVDFTVDTPDQATAGVLNVRDGDGQTIWTEELDLSEGSYTWDGSTADGVEPPVDSLFEFGIDMYEGETYLGTAAPRIITEVTNVASENGQMRLGTSSRLTADMMSVRRVGN